mmetsp:Transcript_21668/g.38098  ORF Transcript_21668/g.38098 Transcript_21668/m.38098 type:complete len:744 (+) Transcript_21668:70-2301(+)|eukprot:CAMPEP_0178861796 /NCGR_PEP_ID=MMETSP0747-20121128/2473_1 /TAXON_ID=913974 /ORGANISM="Nitzschia punctata, Strain CCMP561" /LENGTH=743 /DNA_ID=CAMNT_0020528351 /DNA_START=64 /DNA_END=2295 /DNA_ORIENTATION=+
MNKEEGYEPTNAATRDVDDDGPSPPGPPSEAPQPEIVELAVLALPRAAMDNGLQSGEANHVVLECSVLTVEHIQAAIAGGDDGDDDDEEDGKTASNDTVPTMSTNNAELPSISAVVDLEKLSELLGTTEVVLITGLKQEFQEAHGEAAQEERDTSEKEPDEETPLMPIATITSTDEAIETETGAETGTEHITLLADPFIETLAEVLPPILEEAGTIADISVPGDAITVATSTIAPTEHALADDHPGEQHFAHDAFLLDVPTVDDQGKLEHHFVLALPEIQVEESVQTATSGLSGDDGSYVFMERALSLLPTTTRLPTDIENVHLEATEHIPTKADPSHVHLDVVVERRVPVIGYVILFGGLFALSSVGAALDLQEGGVTATMKTLWRQVATSLVLLPLVVKSFIQDGKPNLSFHDLSLLPVSAAAYTYMTLAFVIALEMTTMANAFVLSNMTSLVIIAGRFVLGMPVLPMEGTGAVTGFFGAAVCAQDAARTMANESGGDVSTAHNSSSDLAMWGNVVALSASFGTAAYLLIAKKLRPKMDLFVFMFAIMACGSIFLFLFMLASGEDITFDLDPVHGVFGWMALQPDRLPLELYLAIICNCFGTTGYIAVMKYFDPLVPATVMLLEPVVGALLGVAARTTSLPGIQTWLGDLVVACGTFLVIYSGSSKKESYDASEALRPRLVGSGDALKVPSVVKSPLLPRNSPALSKGNFALRKASDASCDDSHGGGLKSNANAHTVIWEV